MTSYMDDIAVLAVLYFVFLCLNGLIIIQVRQLKKMLTFYFSRFTFYVSHMDYSRIIVSNILNLWWAETAWGILAGINTVSPDFVMIDFPPMTISASPSRI
jgi:hypothetical protein